MMAADDVRKSILEQPNKPVQVDLTVIAMHTQALLNMAKVMIDQAMLLANAVNAIIAQTPEAKEQNLQEQIANVQTMGQREG